MRRFGRRSRRRSRRTSRAGSISGGRFSIFSADIRLSSRPRDAFLAYPQYWSWRLSGVAASEATSLGAHTDLWRPYEGRLSSMVDKLGWRRLFPPMRKAWDTLGTLKPEVAAATGLAPDVRVICGAHDSNASLVPHLISRRDPFTVISTGTWVIIMAVGGTARLDPKADMLANVDVRGEPVPTARFMGGREYAVLAGDAPADADEADIASVHRLRRARLARILRSGRPVRLAQRRHRGRNAHDAESARRARDALLGADDRPYASAPRSAGRSHRRRRFRAFAGFRRRARPAYARPAGAGRADERRRCSGRGDARPLGRGSSISAARASCRLGSSRSRSLSRSVGTRALAAIVRCFRCGKPPRRKPRFRGVSNRDEQRNGCALGVAELCCAIAPWHHLRLMNHLDLVFEVRELRVDIVDHEFEDCGAVGGGFRAAFLLNRATVSALPMASVAEGVTISANTGANHSAGWPVTSS